MSAIGGLINSTSKLCRVDGRVTKWTFPTLSFEPIDSFVGHLATLQACNFQRQIVEKHGLVRNIEQNFLIWQVLDRRIPLPIGCCHIDDLF